MQTAIVRWTLFFLLAAGSCLGFCACDSAFGKREINGSRGAIGQDVMGQDVPRMFVANSEQQRQLDRAVVNVRVGDPRLAEVGMVLKDLVPIRHQFESGSHYLLAAASYLRDEGLLNEDYDLSSKLSISIGDAALVLGHVRGAKQRAAVNADVLVRDFYDGAESDTRTRALLLEALGAMRAAMGELRDGDVLIVLAR